MMKRGISGIVLCFFCCINFFVPVLVFADNTELGEIGSSQQAQIDSIGETQNQEESEGNIDSQNSENPEIIEVEESSMVGDSENQQDESGYEQNHEISQDYEVEVSAESDENNGDIIEHNSVGENNGGGEISGGNNNEPHNNLSENETTTVETSQNESSSESDTIEFPEIFIDFQNPSYILEKDIQKETYTCDSDYEECKVNIKVLDENQENISGDFGCEIIFSTGEIIQNCNPNTVIFEEENNSIGVKIYEKNNLENFIEKNIEIIKNISEGEDDNQQEDNNGGENPAGDESPQSDNQTGSGEIIDSEDQNGGENIDNTIGDDQNPEIIFPEIFIDFQNPSYILEKDIQKEIYICDSDYEECKVNIKILDENQETISGDFGCEIIFSTGEIIQNCNPNTVIFEEENNSIGIKIYEKNNLENFIQKNIEIIKNISEGADDNQQEDTSGGEDPIGEENPQPDSQSGSGEIIDSEDQNGGDNIDDSFGDELNQGIIFPEIFIDFQNPSYILEKDLEKESYTCDSQYEECKVNIKILDGNQENISGDFGCEIIFSTGEIIQNCNPNTVIFEDENNSIGVKIYEKNNLENFIQKNIEIIKNISEGGDNNQQEGNSGGGDSPGDDSSQSDTQSGSGEIGDNEHQNGGDNGQQENDVENIALPELYLEIQSGAEKNGENIVCDKNECSINFTLEESFEGLNQGDFECEWNFAGGTFSTENTDKKCNPGYVKYGIGNFNLQVKIYQKNNSQNFIQKNYFIINNKKTTHSSKSSGGTTSVKKTPKIISDVSIDKEIIVQSGLENNTCDQENCSVNLKYDNSSYETCEWDFGELETRQKYTQSCNPRNIYVPAGNINITLEVWNEKTQKRHYKNLFIINEYQPTQLVEQNYEFVLTLQGKQLDYKKKIGNKIVCLGVEKCSINLNINNYKELDYKWIFPENHVVEKSNPSSVWFEKGEHEILLEVSQNQQILFSQIYSVEVLFTQDKQEIYQKAQQIEIADKHANNFLYNMDKIEITPKSLLQFKDIGINNVSDSMTKKSEILIKKMKNIDYFKTRKEIKRLQLTRNISQQKKAVKYSGTTFPNSIIFIDNGDELIQIHSDEQGKYENKKTENIHSGNFILDYYVIDQQGNYFQSSSYKNLDISAEYVAQLEKTKLKNETKNIVKQLQKEPIDTYDNTNKDIHRVEYASIIPTVTVSEKMTIYQKILWGMIISLGLLGGFIILKRYRIL